MKNLTRKDFLRIAGLGGTASLVAPGLAFRRAAEKFGIGATFILWGYSADDLEPALLDMKKLGFHAFETFGQVIEEWEENRGGFSEVVEKHGVPVVSAYCWADVVDPSKRKEETEKLTRWAKLLRQSGGKLIEFGCANVDREGYDYKEYKNDILRSLNTFAKAVNDEGLVFALHPHTGTAIETEEEVYFAMENADTRYVKFGPDSGQLQKGGADYIKIFRDFMPLIEHVHLKDYEGGDNGWLGYAPLGEGKQEIEKLLNMLNEGRDEMAGRIMYEQDFDGRIDGRFTNYESAQISRDYLAKLGYQFEV